MQRPETLGVPFLLIACALGITTTVWTGEAAAVPMRTVHDSKNVIAITVPTTWQIQSPSGRAALKATAPSSGAGLPDTVEVVVHIVPAEVTTPLACENEAAWVTQHFGAHHPRDRGEGSPNDRRGPRIFVDVHVAGPHEGTPMEPAGVHRAAAHRLRRDRNDEQHAGG